MIQIVLVLAIAASAWAQIGSFPPSGGSGGGASVSLTGGTGISVSPNPITGTGVITNTTPGASPAGSGSEFNARLNATTFQATNMSYDPVLAVSYIGSGADIFGTVYPNASNKFLAFSTGRDTTDVGYYTQIQSEIELTGAGGISGQWDYVWGVWSNINTKSDSTAAIHLTKGGVFTVDHQGIGVIVNRISGAEVDAHNEHSNSPSGVVNGLQATGENLSGATISWVRGINALATGEGTTATIDAIAGYLALDSGTTTDASGIHIRPVDGGGTVANLYGIKLDAQATIATNQWGLKVADISGGTINRAIETAAGDVVLGTLTGTGAATGKTIVCADTNGKLYRSSSGVSCAN